MRRHQLPFAIMAVAVATSAFAQVNHPVSVDDAGNFGNGFSYFSVISSDGRYVAFQSRATNLVTNDFNGQYDVFLRDLAQGTTELVSLNSASTSSASGLGLSPDISGDGRYVVWESNAANVVVGDTNATWDVFLRDQLTGTNERLSLTSTGAEATERSGGPRITPDGRFVVFESDAALVPGDLNGTKDVYRLDRQAGTLDLVSVTLAGTQGDDWSYHGDVSDDGRFVAFTSVATNLAAGDTNGQADMFWKDMSTGELRRVNVSSAGAQANSASTWPYVSGDGGTVVFSSRASNLVTGDTNSNWDLFAYDVATSATERLNLQPNGAQADEYVRSPASVSTDGRYVLFASLSTNLVPGDTNGEQDVFLRDRAAGTTERLNLSSTGGELNDDSWVPQMTPDVRVITYTSEATNIVAGNTLGERQIFARTLGSSIGTTFCTGVANSTGVGGTLTARGSMTASGNDVTLEAASLPQQSFGYFLTSRAQAIVPGPGGSQGTLCLGGSIGRFVGPGQIQNSGTQGAIQLQLDLTALPQPTGAVPAAPGETWSFQAWYRDTTGGGAPTSNFTDGVEILFD